MSGALHCSTVTGEGTSSAPLCRAHTAWKRWLFLVVLAVYALTAAGQFQTYDAGQELSVAVSIRAGRGVQSDFARDPNGGTVEGRDGWSYTPHDIGSSLLYLPLTVIPGSIRRVPPGAPDRADLGVPGREALLPSTRLYFVASFLPGLLAALTVLVFAFILDELGFDPTTSLLTAFALAFTSTIWVYAHISFDATASALAATCAVWALVRFRRTRSPAAALGTGCALAAAVVIRSDAVIMAPLLLAVLPWLARDGAPLGRRAVLERTLIGIAPVVVAGATNLAYNWWRFGSILESGHSENIWIAPSGSFGQGFFGQVMSADKGMIVYSPLLLAALFGWPRLWRRSRPVAAGILAASLAVLVSHSMIVNWSGAIAWGSRFMVPVVPMLLLPLAFVVDDIRRRRTGIITIGVTTLLALAGLAVQFAGVFVDFSRVVTMDRLRDPDALSQLLRLPYVDGFRVMLRGFRTAQPYFDLPADLVDRLGVARFDLWWVRAAEVSGWNVFTLGIPAALVSVAVWAAFRLHRATRPVDRSLH